MADNIVKYIIKILRKYRVSFTEFTIDYVQQHCLSMVERQFYQEKGQHKETHWRCLGIP